MKFPEIRKIKWPFEFRSILDLIDNIYHFRDRCPLCGGKDCAQFIGFYYRKAVDEDGRYYPDFPSALYRLLVSEGKIQVGGINEGTLRKYVKDNQLRKLAPPVPRKKFEKEHINQLR